MSLLDKDMTEDIARGIRTMHEAAKGLKGTETNEEFLIRSAKKAQQSEYVS